MLKFSCFITGHEYKSLSKDTPFSKRKVMILATAMLIPIMLWLVQGYLLTSVILRTGWIISLLTAILFGVVIFLLERVIVMGNKSWGAITFRGIIGVCFAIIGAIIADEIIFHEDIELKLAEYKLLEKDKVLEISKREDSLYLISLQKRRDDLYVKWEKISSDAIEETDGRGGSGQPGVGDIAKFKDQKAQQFYSEYLKADSLYNDYKSKAFVKEKSQTEIFERNFSPGLLMRIRALWDLISEDLIVRAVWVVFSILIFMLELFVLLTKWTTRESNYDHKVNSIEEIGYMRLENLKARSPQLYDPAADHFMIYGRESKKIFGN